MKFKVRHHSQERIYREPFGAVVCGQNVVIRLQILEFTDGVTLGQCFLRLWETGSDHEKYIPMRRLEKAVVELPYVQEESNEQEADTDRQDRLPERKRQTSIWYEGEIQTQISSPGLIWYYFVLTAGSQQLYYGNNDEGLGGLGQLSEAQPNSWQITVYHPMQIPNWYQRGIMYQIFVDRFAKGKTIYPEQCNKKKKAVIHLDWEDTPFYIKDEQGRVTHWDFFGGNLEGIIQKLPYLQELGISILYLNPIFEAVSNHKYDTGDYHTIDPMYGDDETFDNLVKAAKQYGISLILDGVFSHTGSDSFYFNKEGNYPSLGAYQSPESPYYTWYQFKPGSKEYKCWWNTKDLPEVDELNLSYQQFLFGTDDSVLQKWMKKGVVGWRLDVADELPDEFIKELRRAAKALNPEAVLIGEVWENAANKISYGELRQYFWGYELDGTMNYPVREWLLRFLRGEWEASKVYHHIMSLYETYPRENFYALMNLLGSHDRIRVLSLLGDAPPEENLSDSERRSFRLSSEARYLAVQRLKLFSLLQMTFPGVPSIYYGDEVGMEGYSDPYNRGTFPWGKEDEELKNWFMRLTRLRREYEVLQTGDFQSFYYGEDIFGFVRSNSEEAIWVLVNRNSSVTKKKEVEVELDLDAYLEFKLPFLVLDLMNGEVLSGGNELEAKEFKRKLKVFISPLRGRVVFIKKSFQTQFPPQLSRASGVLLHITSLPSAWGKGDLGESAYHFIDYLAAAHQSLWQILPLNPVGVGNSPYQSDSVFAGNPLLINLDFLIKEGLLQAKSVLKAISEKPAQIETIDSSNIGVSHSICNIKEIKEKLLREAFQAFRVMLAEQHDQSPYLKVDNYVSFLKENADWLDDYGLFRALKSHFKGAPWFDWESGISNRTPEKLESYKAKLSEEIDYHRFVQYTFYTQWQSLKAYAAANKIKLIGDMPLYVAADSCEVWVNRELFKLGEHGKPRCVAGVPPDYFSPKGQRWDSPVYDWEAHANTDYKWWKRRIKQALWLFDYTRIDHFRGLEAYWEIDSREETAVKGHWLKGPGKRFIESLIKEFGKLPFIAEDLGVITPEVETLRRIFCFPGMKVLQFTPLSEIRDKGDSLFIYYSGTHDNDTLLGWYRATHADQLGTMNKANTANLEGELQQACRNMIDDLYMSQAAWVILPLQDILGLDSDARMNVPGTVGENWLWQVPRELLTEVVRKDLRDLTDRSHRNCY